MQNAYPRSAFALTTGIMQHERLIEEAKYFAGHVFPSRLIMVHNASRCSKDNEPELTGWQQLDHPLLKVSKLNVVSRGDDAGFVDSAQCISHRACAASVDDAHRPFN